MNNNYPRYQITSTFGEVSEADWYYAQSELALERGDLYVGFADLTINSGQSSYLQMDTGASKSVFVIGYTITTNSPRLSEFIIEAPTLTSGTTPLTIHNSNRQSSNTPDFVIYSDPAGVTGGTIIDQTETYEAKKAVGSLAEATQTRLQLAKNETYILKITNGDNSNHDVFVKFYLHEST